MGLYSDRRQRAVLRLLPVKSRELGEGRFCVLVHTTKARSGHLRSVEENQGAH